MRPGNGVTMPVEIQKGIPRYTSEAMRARIQGAIMVECVVQTSGVCTDIRVKRSFDPAFGLDQEAIRAAAAVAVSSGHAARAGRAGHRDDGDRICAQMRAGEFVNW